MGLNRYNCRNFRSDSEGKLGRCSNIATCIVANMALPRYTFRICSTCEAYLQKKKHTIFTADIVYLFPFNDNALIMDGNKIINFRPWK